MLFQDIKTERDLSLLKRRVLADKGLYERILRVRSEMHNIEGKHSSVVKIWPQNSTLIKVSEAHKMPTNAEILAFYRELVSLGEEPLSPDAELVMKKLKTRSNSGVAVVSLLTKPFPCPGRCTYCPTEENMPKSYLSKEPAAARALANNFDPYDQVTNRLLALEINGHNTDKIEMIVIGGTWSFYHPKYQEEFLAECFRACNNFSHTPPTSGTLEVGGVQTPKGVKSLAELQTDNETAGSRIIGLSIETRPDYITTYEIERLRALGVTKVEIGVQHLDDAILKLTKRDMKIAVVMKATERLRNAGLKVVYHMMPNLPGSTPERDIAMFGELFSGEDFQPDMLKVYPCMVLEGSELFETWKHGLPAASMAQAGCFKPYTDEELIRVLAGAKKQVPKYVRIIRVIRDIPATYIQAGSKISNLRQWLLADMKKNRWQCKCIRCREVRGVVVDPAKFPLTRAEYRTKTGREIFLSFEELNEGKLASFLRLRLPDKRGEEFTGTALDVLRDAALVRELHTYGQLIPIGAEGTQSQHVGFGKQLLIEAERIAREAGYKKLAIISGIGVREYYRKRGYALEGTYMVKYL